MLKINFFLYFFTISVLISTNKSNAQTNEFGLGVANFTYIGDINQSSLPAKLSPSASVFYKRNNKNHSGSLRLQLSYLKISGSTSNEPSLENRAVSFSNSVFEFDFLSEYNFLDFAKQLANSSKRVVFSPYVFGGIGVKYTLSTSYSFQNNSSPPTFSTVIPFGVGLKALINPYLILSTEMILRKTFNDKIDGLDDNPSISSSVGSDLYYTVGINLSYIIHGINCPISPEKERKRKIIKDKNFIFSK